MPFGDEQTSKVQITLSMDTPTTNVFTLTTSPLTDHGTLSLTFKVQTKNTFLAGPVTGANAQPTFRLIQLGDLPTGVTTGGPGTPNAVPNTLCLRDYTASASFNVLNCTTLNATNVNSTNFAFNVGTIISTNASSIPLTIQGAPSQTANLTVWKNSSGTILGSFSALGVMYATSFQGQFSPGLYNNAIIPNATYRYHRYLVNNTSAFGMSPPVNFGGGSLITIIFKNTTAGAIATPTWDAIYHLVGGTLTMPAAGNFSTITFVYSSNDSCWLETDRSQDFT